MTTCPGFKSDSSISPSQLNKFLAWGQCFKVLEHVLQNFQCFIAGGFPLHCLSPDQSFGDIDFFFSSEEEKEKALEYIKTVVDLDPGESAAYMGESVRAHTFDVTGTVFQFIKAVNGDIPRVLESFDFENSKIALVWNPSAGDYTLVYSPLLPNLLKTKKILFRRQVHAVLDTPEDRRIFAKQNFARLDKYLYRFGGGFWDKESREHVLLQYAFNLQHKKTDNWAMGKLQGKLRDLLLTPETTLEELILFYPLGGDFKTLFEARTRGEVWCEYL